MRTQTERNRYASAFFAALLAISSLQCVGCGGIGAAVGGVARGAAGLVGGAAKGAAGLVGGAARVAGRAAVGAGRVALQLAPAAPAILDTVAQATGSPGVGLARDITGAALGGFSGGGFGGGTRPGGFGGGTLPGGYGTGGYPPQGYDPRLAAGGGYDPLRGYSTTSGGASLTSPPATYTAATGRLDGGTVRL